MNDFTQIMSQVLKEGLEKIDQLDDETLKGYFRSLEGPLE
jgi:hypothetical protein